MVCFRATILDHSNFPSSAAACHTATSSYSMSTSRSGVYPLDRKSPLCKIDNGKVFKTCKWINKHGFLENIPPIRFVADVATGTWTYHCQPSHQTSKAYGCSQNTSQVPAMVSAGPAALRDMERNQEWSRYVPQLLL